MGPGDLARLLAPVAPLAGGDPRVIVGPETSDDAGAVRHGDEALVATADFITPVCDDPERFGRIAAANALSDIYAMGAAPLLALNICCFPETAPLEVLRAILEGAVRVVKRAGAVLLGGHSVRDRELKFGLAVVGLAEPDRLLTNAGARPGDRLVLTKPLGTGVLVNAFRAGRLGESEFDPVLREMERLNDTAAALARRHHARAATDVTGFGLAGHALEMARASGSVFHLHAERLPVHDGFEAMVKAGVTTGATRANRESCAGAVDLAPGLAPETVELVFDPQTSGGLLVAVPAEEAESLELALRAEGHRAAVIGEVLPGEPRVRVA